MSIESYKMLNSILEDLNSEIARMDEQLEYARRCIKEADVYAKSFTNYDLNDYNVFSPRKPKQMHEAELKKTQMEKEDFERFFQEMKSKRNLYFNRIRDIEDVLKSESYSLTVLNVQEEDRQRIARDLHDTSLQNLAHLVHKIELCTLYIDKDPVQAKLELSLVSKCLKETIEEIRNTIFDLRPMTFDDFGFKATLERLFTNIGEKQGLKVFMDIEEVPCETNLILVSIYRVIQESLVNIVKHADAHSVWISCHSIENVCVIDIRDDGVGFNMEDNREKEKHFGLPVMRERIRLLGGKIQIESQVNKGTEIHIEVPLKSYM